MDIYLIYVTFFILILFYIVLDTKNDKIKNKIKFNDLKQNIIIKTKDIKNRNIKTFNSLNTQIKPNNNLLNYCNVPVLNTEQCFKSKFNKCPNTNGSYSQCTNNYIPSPDTFNALCENRTFEMADPFKRISDNCYNILKK